MALDSREAMMIEPGQQVLCVRPGSGKWENINNGAFIDGPQRGQIFTVLNVMRWEDGFVGLHLKEAPQAAWREKFFVPLKKTQTDISVFTEALTKYPAGRPVKATPVPVTPSDIAHAIRNRQLRRLLDQLEKGL